MPRQVHIEFEGPPYPVIGCLSWVGLTGETGLSPRPPEAIGHCPWKLWMNAACVPVSESGDDCPREILVTLRRDSSSGRPRPTRWREWLGSRFPKATLVGASSSGAAPFQRTATHRPALNPAMHPKVGTRFRTPSPDPFAYLRESAFICGSSPRVFRLNRGCP